jgi:hypothetical protein
MNPDHPGHPDRFLTNYELNNFHRYIAANPEGPHSRPEGAFDAMPPGLSRRTPQLRDFGPGGRYDYHGRRGARRLAFDAFESGEQDGATQPDRHAWLAEVLKRLAAKCSPEEWADLHQQLRQDDEGAADEMDPRNALEPHGFGGALNDQVRGMDRRIAQDAKARADFNTLYPQASHSQPDIYRPAPPRGGAASASAMSSFLEMFPEAAGGGK